MNAPVVTDRAQRIHRYLDLNAGYWKGEDAEFAKDVEVLVTALETLACADTHYPSMPTGFRGDWKVLRDIAAAAVSGSEVTS
jgi:hypothetical protein